MFWIWDQLAWIPNLLKSKATKTASLKTEVDVDSKEENQEGKEDLEDADTIDATTGIQTQDATTGVQTQDMTTDVQTLDMTTDVQTLDVTTDVQTLNATLESLNLKAAQKEDINRLKQGAKLLVISRRKRRIAVWASALIQKSVQAHKLEGEVLKNLNSRVMSREIGIKRPRLSIRRGDRIDCISYIWNRLTFWL